MTCSHEAFRAGLGLIAAVLLPLAIPYFDQRRLLRALITTGLVIFALLPWLDRFWPTWCVVVATGTLALFLAPGSGQARPEVPDSTDPDRSPTGSDREGASAPTHPQARLSFAAISVGLILAFLTIILLDPTVLTSLRILLRVSSTASVMIFGWLLATLVAGALIERVVRPFTEELAEIMSKEETRGLRNAGRWIGWLERTIIYGALCAGRPDAVVIIITIKSIARFPQFKQEAFAEYYLVGTLLSLLAAITVGGTVRVLRCWPAIPV